MAGLTTFRTAGGVPFTVHADHAPRFQAFANELEASGYKIDAKQSGGYNYRTIAGTNTLSNHAHGAAIDVNWSANPRGRPGDMPANIGALAEKHGLVWGGTWKNPDPMHFEVAGAKPLAAAPSGPAPLGGLAPATSPPTGATPMAAGYDPTQVAPTPEDIAHRRKYGYGLMQEATSSAPVGHWTQGLARVLGGIAGAGWVDSARQDELTGQRQTAQAIMGGLALPGTTPPAPAMAGPGALAPPAGGLAGGAAPTAAPVSAPSPASQPAAVGGIGGGAMGSAAGSVRAAQEAGMLAPAAGTPAAAPMGGVTRSTIPAVPAPSVLKPDPRLSYVDTQLVDIDRRQQLLAPLLANPRTQAIALSERQRLDDRRARLEEQKIGMSDPLKSAQQRMAELDITAKERELANPAAKTNILPEGGSLAVTDPRTGQTQIVAKGGDKLSDGDKTRIEEADNAVQSGRAAVGALAKALELSKTSFAGPTAGLRASITGLTGPGAGQNTQLMNNLVQEQALQSLKATFGGNPTEGERKVLLDLQGSANMPQDVRETIWKRAIAMAEQRITMHQQRADQVRGGTYYKPGGGSAASGGAPSPTQGKIEERKSLPNGKTAVKIDGQWYEE